MYPHLHFYQDSAKYREDHKTRSWDSWESASAAKIGQNITMLMKHTQRFFGLYYVHFHCVYLNVSYWDRLKNGPLIA